MATATFTVTIPRHRVLLAIAALRIASLVLFASPRVAAWFARRASRCIERGVRIDP